MKIIVFKIYYIFAVQVDDILIRLGAVHLLRERVWGLVEIFWGAVCETNGFRRGGGAFQKVRIKGSLRERL